MKENEEKNIILNSIADGVFTIDMDFHITSMNRAAENILGITEKEALGRLCFEVFHGNICEHSCALKETLKSGTNIINKTIYIVNSRGNRVPISVSTALLKDEKGDIMGGVETFRDMTAIETLRREIEATYTFEDIVSKSKQMRDILNILPDIAESDSSVLIEGQSGTGKELVARAIHHLSHRSHKPLVVINCAAVPDNLLESELFGYKAGAFTDAKKDKPGKIALAEGGTVFLDEIGEISQSVQVKLLRFLQEREFEPLGGLAPVKANVRIIAATNRIIPAEIREGRFREDLYYRINVVNIGIPPLSERKADIPYLINHFIRKYNILKGRQIEGVSDEVMNKLMSYEYPGNIRELENIIEHAFVLCHEAYIRRGHLPRNFNNDENEIQNSGTLQEIERLFIIKSLENNSWNRTKAAKDLGIDSSTLWRKMKKHAIQPKD